MKSKKNKKKIFDSIYEGLNKYWFLSVALGKLSGVWFALFIAYCGFALKLTKTDSNGGISLTVFGIILTAIILLSNLGIALIERYYRVHDKTKIDLEIATAERDLSNTVSESVHSLCRIKMDNQLKQIKQIKNGTAKADHVYTQPCTQLKNISDKLADNISFLCSEKSYVHDKEDFLVGLMYNFPKENPNVWKLADSFSDIAFSPEELLTENSTLNFLLHSKRPHIFFNSKQKAFEEHHYIKSNLDEYDSDGHLKGSIICVLNEFKHDNEVYIRAVLTVSTKEKQIIDQGKFVANENQDLTELTYGQACEKMLANIKNNVFKFYWSRIGIELCNYYIQYLYNNNSSNND